MSFEIIDREVFEVDITDRKTTTQNHDTNGEAPEISNLRIFTAVPVGSEYFEAPPKGMITSMPGDLEGNPATRQVVAIKGHFNKPGRYVWHRHIVSHEDHEMMRVLQLG